MRRVSTDDIDLPSGYEVLKLDSRASIALPASVALASRQALAERESAMNEARREELRRSHDEAKERAAESKREEEGQAASQLAAKRQAFSLPPAAGMYRVLPNLQAMLDGSEDAAAALRSADADINKRLANIRDVLVEKGPDRRVAKPENWRHSLAKLEASLPHFVEPIRLLRSSLALAEATERPVRIPPMLLLGPPGLGKTYFTHRVARMLRAPCAAIGFDQPSAGSALRGSDSHWSNSSSGILFNTICMGECANPVVLLDELDKSAFSGSNNQVDPLAQLHAVLEPETSRQTLDISVNIEFDASLVTYVATANTVRGIEGSILSRLEVFVIEPPSPSASVEIARRIVNQALGRLGLHGRVRFDRRALYLLAHLSPRLMVRSVDKAVAEAVAEGRAEVGESNLWAVTRMGGELARLH